MPSNINTEQQNTLAIYMINNTALKQYLKLLRKFQQKKIFLNRCLYRKDKKMNVIETGNCPNKMRCNIFIENIDTAMYVRIEFFFQWKGSNAKFLYNIFKNIKSEYNFFA